MEAFLSLILSKVVTFGMNDKVGNISFEMPREGEPSLDKPYSEATAQLIDEQVRELIDLSHRTTTDLLTKHKEDVEKVSTYLTLPVTRRKLALC